MKPSSWGWVSHMRYRMENELCTCIQILTTLVNTVLLKVLLHMN